MRPTVIDRVAWSVGRSVTLVSPAKTAEPIEMTFGLWSWMGPRNHVLDGSPEALMDVAMATNFGTEIATVNVWTIATRLLVTELRSQPIKCRYCLYTATKGHWDGKHFWLSIFAVHIGATRRIRLNRPCAAAMRPYVKLLWPLVIFVDCRLGLAHCFCTEQFKLGCHMQGIRHKTYSKSLKHRYPYEKPLTDRWQAVH